MNLLPPEKYAAVPSVERGHELAAAILDKIPPRIGGLAIAKTILDQQQWNLRYRDSFPLSSTLESLLVPLLHGGFTVVLNTRRFPADPQESKHREAFLIGHEIAHSFFYSEKPGKIPRRIFGALSTPEEEYFCDAFGDPFSERR
ncbi:MAG: hypothetical protein ABIR46_00080 [Candidatus Saccharimonadales bacterium]